MKSKITTRNWISFELVEGHHHVPHDLVVWGGLSTRVFWHNPSNWMLEKNQDVAMYERLGSFWANTGIYSLFSLILNEKWIISVFGYN